MLFLTARHLIGAWSLREAVTGHTRRIGLAAHTRRVDFWRTFAGDVLGINMEALT